MYVYVYYVLDIIKLIWPLVYILLVVARRSYTEYSRSKKIRSIYKINK